MAKYKRGDTAMNKQADQKRQRLLHDTQDVKVWYKLYKSGTKWIVAGIATATFGLSIMATPAKADTVADDPTTSTSIATTDSTPPVTTTTDESTVSANDVATTPSQPAATSAADATTEAAPVAAPADQSASTAPSTPIASAPVAQQPTAPT